MVTDQHDQPGHQNPDPGPGTSDQQDPAGESSCHHVHRNAGHDQTHTTPKPETQENGRAEQAAIGNITPARTAGPLAEKLQQPAGRLTTQGPTPATIRPIQQHPVDLPETDCPPILPLPPPDPPAGLNHRAHPAHDNHIHVDTDDHTAHTNYPANPQAIGKSIDMSASPTTVTVPCKARAITRHQRSRAKQTVITDPAHVTTTHTMHQALATKHHQHQTGTRHHTNGHTVALQALPAYDALFGIDSDPEPTKASNE
ncbi:hypothetical protein ACFT8W_00280 [Streptomyces hygroscopicus]|uniref:Mu transposase domain-containing protein n=1 Tax=Streptomyces hygroscopicus TaxID=1912 RepID=UPI0036340BAB